MDKFSLTEEDWKSGEADDFAFAVLAFVLAALAALALVLAALALVLAALATHLAFAVAFVLAFAFAVLAALALVLAFPVFVIEPVPKITPMYYIFRFPGAWWHHRKRLNTTGEI
jgi:hypothetical protein